MVVEGPHLSPSPFPPPPLPSLPLPQILHLLHHYQAANCVISRVVTVLDLWHTSFLLCRICCYSPTAPGLVCSECMGSTMEQTTTCDMVLLRAVRCWRWLPLFPRYRLCSTSQACLLIPRTPQQPAASSNLAACTDNFCGSRGHSLFHNINQTD